MEVLFWVSVAGVVYPYVGYPLALWLIARFTNKRTAKVVEELPRLSIIIPVHNEERRLARKIANTTALEYPSDRVEIIFVSDGSTDGSVEMIRTSLGPGRHLV